MRGFLLVAALALSARPTEATTVVPLTLEQALGHADVVVRARVIEARARWGTHEGRRAIVTDVTLGEERPLAGEPLRTLTVFGGTLDGVTMTLAGQPTLRAGDDVLLLVDRDAAHCPFVGVWHGVYHVRDGQVTREGRPVIDVDAEGHVVLGRPRERGVAPETFERLVRAALERARARERR